MKLDYRTRDYLVSGSHANNTNCLCVYLPPPLRPALALLGGNPTTSISLSPYLFLFFYPFSHRLPALTLCVTYHNCQKAAAHSYRSGARGAIGAR